MKTLHSITTTEPVVFFDLAHPCKDEYHNGFPHERSDRLGHENCIQNILHQPDTHTGKTCACLTCATHWFAIHMDKWDLRQRCEGCRTENHPLTTVENTDQRTNPWMDNGDIDPFHEHEWDEDEFQANRDQTCVHCGIWMEED